MAEGHAPAPADRPPALTPTQARTIWIVVAVLGGILLTCAAVFFVAVMFTDEPSDLYVLSFEDASAIEGRAAEIFDLGQRGDIEGILALAVRDEHTDLAGLRRQMRSAFGTMPVDYTMDEARVQVLVDQETDERICVIRLDLTGQDGTASDSGPIYLIKADDEWRLTGLKDRTVKAAE